MLDATRLRGMVRDAETNPWSWSVRPGGSSTAGMSKRQAMEHYARELTGRSVKEPDEDELSEFVKFQALARLDKLGA